MQYFVDIEKNELEVYGLIYSNINKYKSAANN